MRTIKRTVTPVLAFLLALLMAVYLFPADVAALPGGGEPEIIEPVGPAAEPEEQTVDALFELTEQRTADTKYIRMSDGTVKALTYGGAVHRADEDGVWREIDNSLTEKEESVESDRVSFVKTVSEDGALYTLTDGEKRISVSLAGAQPDTSVTVTNDGRNEEKFETKLEELSTLTKLVSSLRYDGILPETDLEYILHGEDLKENIVINAPSDSYTYSFTLSLENLTAELREDGAVVLYAEDEPAYIIPAPYMTDAENEYSDAVGYTLEDLGEGNYTLTVAADKDWIEEEGRVFPVTVDPTILHMQYRGFLQDTYVIAGNNTGYPNNANMRVGKVGASTVCKAYYSIGDMPQGMDLPLLSAQLQLRCNAFQYNGTDPVYLYLTRTESFLSDLTTITDQTNVPTVAESAIEIELSAGDTSFSFNLLDTYFLLETITDREVSYCLTMNDLFNTSVIVKSMESSYMPSLILSYGYCVPEEILSTSVSAHDKPFDLTNDRGQLEPGCTMLIPSGTALDNITYDPTNTAARLCFVRTGNNAETVKICFYGSGKYLSTVSASPGAPVCADPYGDWDSWTVIRLNTGAAIILSTSCSGMVLTRRVLPGTQIVSACIDYLSNDEIDNQLWRIADPINDGRTIDTGVYYINSNNTKKFLVISGSMQNLVVSSATIGEYGNRMSWIVSYIGNGKYTLQSVFNVEKFLFINSSGVGLASYTGFPEAKSLFTIEPSGDCYTIKSDTGYYLIVTAQNLLGYSTTSGSSAKWRFCKNEDYRQLSDYGSTIQMSSNSTFSMNEINKTPSNPTWTSFSDFEYDFKTSGVVDYSGGLIISLNNGITTVVAHHIPTDQKFAFAIVVGDLPVYSLVHYIDQGYSIRFSGNYSPVSDYNDAVATKFEKLFGIDFNVSYSYFTSNADTCKILMNGYVSSSSLSMTCVHNPCHLTQWNVIKDFTEGSSVLTRVFWIGHVMSVTQSSYSYTKDENGDYYKVFIGLARTTDAALNYSNKTVDEVADQSEFTLIHECSHQLGAPDHYCYGRPDPNTPCGNEHCDFCVYGMLERSHCVMTSGSYYIGVDDDKIYCDNCLNNIALHLSEHHQ